LIDFAPYTAPGFLEFAIKTRYTVETALYFCAATSTVEFAEAFNSYIFKTEETKI